ncbi:hypothetical protein [Roseateles sp.]|uniref:hypothetical protein n=1 Tax=Roseateles sp. TaxID=1971397 RepID=UPI0031CF7E71
MQFFPLRPVMAAALMLAGLQAHAKSEPVDEPPATTETPAQASAWKVFKGQSYRVEADGNFSCYSEDGQHCKPGTPSDDETLVKPLTCGAPYADKYSGATGYDQTNHWCNVAYANLFAKWQDYEMLGFRLLLSKTPNNDTMCMSSDGTNCEWGQQKGEPAPGRLIAPVVCGKALLGTQWQITGYEPGRADHWCQSREIVASADTHLLRRHEPQEVGTLMFSVQLPDWTANENPEFIVRATSFDIGSPFVSVVDRNGNRVSAGPGITLEGSRISFRILRDSASGQDRFAAFMTEKVGGPEWPKEHLLREKLHAHGSGNVTDDVWRDAIFLGHSQLEPWESERTRNRLTINYGLAEVPVDFEKVPEFVMTLPRKKPRY